MTDQFANVDKRFDCSTPLLGKYVTLQKYASDDDGGWGMELAEVELFRAVPAGPGDKQFWSVAASPRDPVHSMPRSHPLHLIDGNQSGDEYVGEVVV